MNLILINQERLSSQPPSAMHPGNGCCQKSLSPWPRSALLKTLRPSSERGEPYSWRSWALASGVASLQLKISLNCDDCACFAAVSKQIDSHVLGIPIWWSSSALLEDFSFPEPYFIVNMQKWLLRRLCSSHTAKSGMCDMAAAEAKYCVKPHVRHRTSTNCCACLL